MVAHRDLKLDNVLVAVGDGDDEDGGVPAAAAAAGLAARLRVADFGRSVLVKKERVIVAAKSGPAALGGTSRSVVFCLLSFLASAQQQQQMPFLQH